MYQGGILKLTSVHDVRIYLDFFDMVLLTIEKGVKEGTFLKYTFKCNPDQRMESIVKETISEVENKIKIIMDEDD